MQVDGCQGDQINALIDSAVVVGGDGCRRGIIGQPFCHLSMTEPHQQGSEVHHVLENHH